MISAQDVEKLIQSWESGYQEYPRQVYVYDDKIRSDEKMRSLGFPKSMWGTFGVHMRALVKDDKIKTHFLFWAFPTEESKIRGLIEVFRAKKNLKSISFSRENSDWSSISANTWKQIFSAIGENKSIERLELDIPLRTLKLDKEKVEIFAEGIKTNEHLQEVSISHSDIGSLPTELFQTLLTSIFANPNIKVFYMGAALNESQQSYFLDLLEKSKSVTHFYKPGENSKYTELEVMETLVKRKFTPTNYDRLLQILQSNKKANGIVETFSSGADQKRNIEQEHLDSKPKSAKLSDIETTDSGPAITRGFDINKSKSSSLLWGGAIVATAVAAIAYLSKAKK